MNKKIIIIIIFIVSIALIGAGVYFSITDKEGSGFGPIVNSNGDEEIVDLEKELEENEEIHTENIHKYKSLVDAVEYLKNIYATTDVIVSSSDDSTATIKVFGSTENEVIYIYYIGPGDLLIDY